MYSKLVYLEVPLTKKKISYTNGQMLEKADILGKLIMSHYHIFRAFPVFVATKPIIHDLILFGSTAAGKETPGDLDLLLVATGAEKFIKRRDTIDSYANLPGIFDYFCDLIGLKKRKINSSGCKVKIDLKIIDKAFFDSSDARNVEKNKELDPRFYNNVFSKAMRFELRFQEFVPITLEQLEDRYLARLDDLRL